VVIISAFQAEDASSILAICSKKRKTPYIGRISTVEREPGSQRIATFTESNHAPGCYVGDPALLCTAPGDGEQTIGKKLDHVNAHGGLDSFLIWSIGEVVIISACHAEVLGA